MCSPVAPISFARLDDDSVWKGLEPPSHERRWRGRDGLFHGIDGLACVPKVWDDLCRSVSFDVYLVKDRGSPCSSSIERGEYVAEPTSSNPSA